MSSTSKENNGANEKAPLAGLANTYNGSHKKDEDNNFEDILNNDEIGMKKAKSTPVPVKKKLSDSNFLS